MSDVGTRLPDGDREALDCVIRSMASADRGEIGYRLIERNRLPGSTSLVVQLTGTGSGRELFVKRLRAQSKERHQAAETGSDRPRVKPVPDPATRLSDEAVALAAIERMVADADRGDWFAVPVVSVPECPDTLVLDRVVAPTLAQQVAGGASQTTLGGAARSLGEWLHSLHTRLPALPQARPYLRDAADIATLSVTMMDYIDSRRLDRRREFIMEAISSLPTILGVVPSHGDFAPQNVFVTDDGAIAVFDTTGTLLMPPHFDLAYFSVVLEFGGYKQLVPRRSETAARLAEQLMAGYGPDAPSRSEIVTFELVLLLDRWSSISRRPNRSSLPASAARWCRRQALAEHIDRGIARRLDELAG